MTEKIAFHILIFIVGVLCEVADLKGEGPNLFALKDHKCSFLIV